MKPAARRSATALVAALLVACLAACAPPGTKPELVPSDEGVTPVVVVRAFDNAYEPREVSIKPGDAVQWVFKGISGKHDVVALDGSFVSELVYEGTYTHVFDEAGVFDYNCSIHPEMTGVVKVG